jgi:hypothetical protein
MSNYSNLPIQIPAFFKNNQEETTEGCKGPTSFYKDCMPKVEDGFHAPLNEMCTVITQNKGPEESCSGVWNNLTKRKSLVRDY